MRTLLLSRAELLADIPDLRVVGSLESDQIRVLTEWAAAHGRTVVFDLRAASTAGDCDGRGHAGRH